MQTPLNRDTGNEIVERYIGTAYDKVKVVADNIAEITSAAALAPDVAIVVGAIANINAVGVNIANVNIVASADSDITSVAGSVANVNAVAGNVTNVNAVAAIAANIAATSSNAVDISFVADNITAITAAATTLETLSFATSVDGWTAPSDAWVYVDANTFKVVGVDRTAIFPVGAKIQLVNPATKFFYVASVVFGTDTVVSLLPNSSYSLANSAITIPQYSYQDTPGGFPNWGSANQTSALAAEVASLIAFSDSDLSFPPSTFRLDVSAANQAVQTNVNGQSVSSLVIGNILHFGDGYIPIPPAEVMNIVLTVQMSTAVASKNVKLVVNVYNSTGTSVRQVSFDDVAVSADTAEATISLSNVLLDTDITEPTEGRVEIQRLATTTNEHPGDIQVKKAVVTYV